MKQQDLMNEVYDKWEQLDGWSRLGVVEEFFTPKHKIAVQFGNLHQQVNNGGWQQWMDNGYGSEDIVDLIEYCKKASKLDIKHLDKLFDILLEVESIGNLEDYEDEEYEYFSELFDEYDNKYYKFGEDEILKSFEEFIDRFDEETNADVGKAYLNPSQDDI